MAKLFEPVTTGGLTLKNHVIMPPMCMYEVGNEDGLPTAFHHAHYGARAIGGVGLIIQEATAVEAVGRLTSHDLGIWNDEQAQALTGLVDEVHTLGAKMGIQLGHGGRKAADEADPVAPSAVEYDDQGTYASPHALTTDEIKATVQAFAVAAKRAEQAGYDMIQLHAAHGYLINQFLEPTTNLRTDAYGGSLAKRFEFLKEIVIAIQAVTSLPIWVRLSVTAYADHQNSIADYQQIAQWLENLGVKAINVSTGGLLPLAPNFPVYGGYQIPFATQIKQAVSIPVTGVGLIDSPTLAEHLLQTNQVDLVEIGRTLIREPNWLVHAAHVLHDHDFAPYNHSYERGTKGY